MKTFVIYPLFLFSEVAESISYSTYTYTTICIGFYTTEIHHVSSYNNAMDANTCLNMDNTRQ